jgi:hypothetical protein
MGPCSKVQSTSIFSCLPWGLIRWVMPRYKLLGPVMHTLGVWPIHNMPPSVHYMPKVCTTRHKKMCPGSCSMKVCPIITRHVLVEHSGSCGKEEAHGTLRTHCCFNVLHFKVPFSRAQNQPQMLLSYLPICVSSALSPPLQYGERLWPSKCRQPSNTSKGSPMEIQKSFMCELGLSSVM